MQACGINDVPDFLAEAIRNPIKADFQRLDDGLLLGNSLGIHVSRNCRATSGRDIACRKIRSWELKADGV